jgi:endoglucanase
MAKNDHLSRWLAIARGLLNCPTATLMEEIPFRHILDFAAERPVLRTRRDRAGNLYVGYPANVFSHRTPLVLVAHLDHPGFWVEKVKGREIQMRFRGGVMLEHAAAGTRVRFFRRGQSRATGRGRILRAEGENSRIVSATASIDSGAAEPGGFAMWDLPAFSLRNGKIVTRCCDDLLGAAAALCVLDELARTKPKGAAVWALFTRAEEVGFYGALMAVKDREIPKNARVISLECSKALPHAPQNGGVIVRVGDAASLFDATFTEALRQVCNRIKKDDPEFKFQRRLMDGGTCEATAFCSAGYRASGLALPLGNYHNQAVSGTRKKIGPENIAIGDYAAEVRLLIELAKLGRGIEKLEGTTRGMLAERAQRASEEFRKVPLLDT